MGMDVRARECSLRKKQSRLIALKVIMFGKVNKICKQGTHKANSTHRQIQGKVRIVISRNARAQCVLLRTLGELSAQFARRHGTSTCSTYTSSALRVRSQEFRQV